MLLVAGLFDTASDEANFRGISWFWVANSCLLNSTHDLSTSANSEKDSSGVDAARYDQPFNYHNSMD
jgi:hypothetical protein